MRSKLSYIKPLFWLSIGSTILGLSVVPLWLLDDRTLGGVSIWEKPLKFFISAAIFGVTYSWLSSFIQKRPRLVRVLGWAIAISLVIELTLITSIASLGQTSHFNVSSATAITIWSLMANFITMVLIATLILSILIILDKSQTLEMRIGLGLGSLNASIGMGLAFLMTSPTANQLANFQGIAGAHSVGVEDGGPGLPLLGWSTVAGDLRVGHFFGLHSIQVAMVLLVLASLLPAAWQLRTLVVGNLAYLGFIGIVTWQALRAEPFSSPSNLTITSIIFPAVGAGLVLALIAIFSRLFKSGSKA